MKIKELTIYTKNFWQQVDFYSHKIELELIEAFQTQAIFRVGKSTLRIVESERSQPYHFAINIPCNKEDEALEWLRNRVDVLKYCNNEIHVFDSWNARALYFYDPDHNIVEFIARKNLKNEALVDFDSGSLLEISEIGMPVSRIESAVEVLQTIANIKIYDGGFEDFCAVGDEHGLFICIDRQVRNWFPTGDRALSSAFKIRFQEDGNEYEIAVINEEITVM